MRCAALTAAALIAVCPAGAARAQPAGSAMKDNSPECFARFGKPGMPVTRSESARDDQSPPFCRRGYAFVFNTRARNPDWVMERLTRTEVLGKADRNQSPGFKPDPLIKKDPVQPNDYLHSGFDRGHQAPAGDAKFSQPVMDASFYMTNMAPQVGPKFNRGEWKYLEEEVRAWVLCGGREQVFVMTGPIYAGPARPMGKTEIRIPDSFYKIVYDPGADRAVGFILPNKGVAKTPFAKFAVKIADIEDATGLDFFPAFTQRHQKLLEANVGAVWGHTADCKSTSGD